MTVMVDLVVIAVLFLFAVAMTYQRPRSWLVQAAREMAARSWPPRAHPGLGAGAHGASG